MSTISGYPARSFDPSQKFLVLDPSTQTTALVLGSDLVSYITPSLDVVRTNTTRAAALNEDYEIGTFVQTAGGAAIDDGGNGMYLVVAAGDGDYAMLNGNELLLLPFGTLVGSDLDGALVTDDGVQVTIESAIAKREVHFSSLESLRASTCTYDYVTVDAANEGGSTGRMELYNNGTTGTPTTNGNRFSALAAGTFFNAGGIGYSLRKEQFINPDMFYDGGDYADAIEYMDIYADANRVACFFYSKQYTITRTVTRTSQSAWFGPAQVQNTNSNNECIIYGTVANIGDGNPLIRCAPSAGTTHNQSISFANISFESNKTVDSSSLSTATNDGVTLVDISNVKDGLTFTGCAFRNAWHGCRQVDTDPYLDKVTFDRCHFVQLYRAIDANPTAGLHLTNCFLYNCVDYIDSTTDVQMVTCSLNNSSFATERTSVSAATIVMIGGWIEGGNRVIRPTTYAHMDGVKCSETFSASGATKFLIEPQNENCTIRFIGSRVPTNTRLMDLSNITNKYNIWVECMGAYNGTNFSDAASISTQLAAGMNYRGFGNTNSSSWNLSENKYTKNIAANYELIITDLGILLYHTSGGTHTITIPANASVAFPLGTEITIINPSTGGAITLAITTDSLEWAASTGSRTLATNSVAVLRKVSSTTWRLSGEGIS